ncbi:MAG: 3-hydroxybutyryl-CoA dehydrogenase [Neomegalonema sp.]|nr:3-hydroxybutyryl-CoA dehydrogenase [Neomegalonema sp.]
MGAGIAQVFAQAGFEVRLNDVSESQLTAARERIARNLESQIRKGRMSPQDSAATLAHLHLCPKLADLGSADLVIESATEREAIKQEIFRALHPHLGADTVLATNTSSISVTRLAANTDRPERFMGVHFMNPVPVMKLVELIRGIATDQSTFDMLCELVVRIGKISTTSEDYPAFIVNRVLIPMINEACYVLFEGVGNVTSIDASMRLGANHPMGPLELADFIGLDTCLAIMHVLNDGLADTKYRPCPLLVKYVEAGWLGRKAGRGFYDYRGEQPVPTR